MATKHKCIECQSFDVRSFPEHTKTGQASCVPRMAFFPIGQEIECKDYAPAPQQTIDKRIYWNNSE